MWSLFKVEGIQNALKAITAGLGGKENHRITPPAQGGAEGSVRLLNPTRSFSCPATRYAVSRLNGFRCSGRQLARYRAPSSMSVESYLRCAWNTTRHRLGLGPIGRLATIYPLLAVRKPASTAEVPHGSKPISGNVLLGLYSTVDLCLITTNIPIKVYVNSVLCHLYPYLRGNTGRML